MFDWPVFLTNQSIDFITSGSSITRGNIGLKCPWCGPGSSYPLGVSLSGKGWHCWKNEDHSGIAPHRLIVALIGCSYQEASRLVGAETQLRVKDRDFESEMLGMLGQKTLSHYAPSSSLEPLDEFKPIVDSGRCYLHAFPYMRKRGYSDAEFLKLAKRFDLSFTASGPFAYRIIIPLKEHGGLVNWTGRSVASSEQLRYKSLSTDIDKARQQRLPIAPRNIKECLFDYDRLLDGGDTLVVVEGPFDAMRMTFFGERYEIKSTCLFGQSITKAQMELLSQISDRFDNKVALLDRDADLSGFAKFPESLGFKSVSLPRGIKDPAELDKMGFEKLFQI